MGEDQKRRFRSPEGVVASRSDISRPVPHRRWCYVFWGSRQVGVGFVGEGAYWTWLLGCVEGESVLSDGGSTAVQPAEHAGERRPSGPRARRPLGLFRTLWRSRRWSISQPNVRPTGYRREIDTNPLFAPLVCDFLGSPHQSGASVHQPVQRSLLHRAAGTPYDLHLEGALSAARNLSVGLDRAWDRLRRRPLSAAYLRRFEPLCSCC